MVVWKSEPKENLSTIVVFTNFEICWTRGAVAFYSIRKKFFFGAISIHQVQALYLRNTSRVSVLSNVIIYEEENSLESPEMEWIFQVSSLSI